MSTWILLRGLTREARHWGDFGALLRAQVEATRVVALDLPGCGNRRGERSPATIEGIVASCRAALRAQGLAPPYRVLALSLGAMVAIAWSARHPDEVLGAVLVNTSLRGHGRWYRRLDPRRYARLLAVAWSRDAEAAERTILALSARHPAVDPTVLVPRWAEWRRERPVARADALRQLWAAARFRAPRRPPVPLLVLASAGDALVDPTCSMRLARAWQADLGVHPTAGHDLPLDDPLWVARTVAAWLERRPQVPRKCLR